MVSALVRVMADEPIKAWTGWVRRSQLGPEGLCADRTPHEPHLHESESLGRYWCTADESQREPGRSERRRVDQGVVHGIRPHLPMTPDELAEREQVMRALAPPPMTPEELARFMGTLSF